MPDTEMSRADVCDFLNLAASLGIRVWLDGGWAVDAWLGRQTRPHADIDIVVETSAAPRLVTTLRERGYADVPRPDTRPWNFVLGDAQGHEIDFHLIDVAPDGTGAYGPGETGFRFPADALTATTAFCGRAVLAVPPQRLVEFHTGYEHDADDRADVLALCEAFDLRVPDAYRTDSA
jgi:lincosamide nucleotidyltransferase A/C/D/E